MNDSYYKKSVRERPFFQQISKSEKKSQYAWYVKGTRGSQIVSLAGAHAGFEQASPVCPILAQSWQRARFDRGPHGQPAWARTRPFHIDMTMGCHGPSPYGARAGIGWAALAHTNPMVPMVALTNPARDQSGLAIWVMRYHRYYPFRPLNVPLKLAVWPWITLLKFLEFGHNSGVLWF